jgi:outer membrane protein assembly factor BamB
MIRRPAGIWLAILAGALTSISQSGFADSVTPPVSSHNDIYRGDTGRSGYTTEPLTTPLSLVWKHTTQVSKTTAAGAVFSNGVIYFGNGENIYAIKAADGTQLWTFAADGNVNTSPDIANGSVYIGTENGELYKIDAYSGRQKWVAKLTAPIHSAPLVVDSVVYVGDDDGFCSAINADNGHTIWNIQTNGPVAAPPVYTADRQVIFASGDNSIRSIDAANGRSMWATKVASDPTFSPPIYSDNAIYVGYSNCITSLLPRSGTARWKALLPSDITTPLAVGKNIIYFATQNNDVLAVDDRGHTIWSKHIGYPTSSAPLIAGRTVIVTTTHGVVYAFAADTGNLLWQYVVQFVATDTQQKADSTAITTPPDYSDGTLFVLSNDGSLSAFQTTGIDKIPPQISSLVPIPGSTIGGVRIPYSAVVADEGSGVIPSSVTLTVDGVLIQPAAYDSAFNGIHLTDSAPKLKDGSHLATITAKDWRGNSVTKTWGFIVDNSFSPTDIQAPAPLDYSTIVVPTDHTPSPSGTYSSPAPKAPTAAPQPPPL